MNIENRRLNVTKVEKLKREIQTAKGVLSFHIIILGALTKSFLGKPVIETAFVALLIGGVSAGSYIHLKKMREKRDFLQQKLDREKEEIFENTPHVK